MEGESKNWWPTNYSKPEIWPAEPERLRTSGLDYIANKSKRTNPVNNASNKRA